MERDQLAEKQNQVSKFPLKRIIHGSIVLILYQAQELAELKSWFRMTGVD